MLTSAPVGTVSTARVCGAVLRGSVSVAVVVVRSLRPVLVLAVVDAPRLEAVDVTPAPEAVAVPARVVPAPPSELFVVPAGPQPTRA